MPRQIYVNLPVRDLQRSLTFFIALGWELIAMQPAAGQQLHRAATISTSAREDRGGGPE